MKVPGDESSWGLAILGVKSCFIFVVFKFDFMLLLCFLSFEKVVV